MYRGTCDVKHSFAGELPVPCVYNGEPQKLNSFSLERIRKNVPDLYEKFNTFCCDDDQVQQIWKQMTTPRAFLGRCPTCLFNFARVFYEMTCHPNQAEFLNVTISEDVNGGKKKVMELVYYLSQDVMDATFESCAHTQMSNSGSLALDMMCNDRQGKDCTPEDLFRSIGDEQVAPFQTNFTAEAPSGYKVLDFDVPSCDQAAKSFKDYSCTCTDCPTVCRPPAPLPSDPTEWKVLGVSGTLLVAALGYSALLIASVAVYVVYNTSRNDSQRNAIVEESIEDNTPSEGEAGQSAFHEKLCQLFGSYGELCSTTPYCYLLPLLGLVIAIILSCGLVYFNPITDPIELWSTETNQARVEKKIFDTHFDPFYRVENLVITPKNSNPVIDKNQTYGPAFERQFLKNVLELQLKLMNLTIEVNDTSMLLSQLCFSPMNNGICMIQSPMGWFQERRDLIDRPDYLVHISNCIRTPSNFNDSLGLQCMGSYGGPIFPHIALADYPDDEYLEAKALVITITLNNHVEKAQNENALKWEKKFLDFLKNYSDPSMDVVYYSEVSWKL